MDAEHKTNCSEALTKNVDSVENNSMAVNIGEDISAKLPHSNNVTNSCDNIANLNTEDKNTDNSHEDNHEKLINSKINTPSLNERICQDDTINCGMVSSMVTDNCKENDFDNTETKLSSHINLSEMEQSSGEVVAVFPQTFSEKDDDLEVEIQLNSSGASLQECKYSSSADSLSLSDTPLGDLFLSKTKDLDNFKSGNCSLVNPPYQFSEDESDNSLSELESEIEYGDAKRTFPSSPNQTNSTSKKQRVKKFENMRSGPTVEYYELQLEFLENNNKKLLSEMSEVKSKLSVQEAEFKKKQIQTKVEFEAKLEKISKQCEVLRKDKEAMVIRYANSEKEVILAKKAQTELEKKMRDVNRDRENLSNKIKALSAERNRLCTSLDNKMVELATLQREHEKLKEDISSKDIKIKWVQNKLKTEMDSHKETQLKLDHTLHRLQETREEAEQVRKDCQEMIRRYQDAEEIKSVKLDHQLKQKLSELEVQKQERSDQEEVYQLLRQELEALKKKQRITIEENNSLTLKIHSLEKERLEYEQTLSKLKDNQNSLKQEVVDLTARLAEMENLSLQLDREKEKFSASLREVERLRQTNAELQSDMDACHMKEGELLEFTERLTAKTVHLQSEHSILEAKAQTLEEEVSRMNKQHSEMEQKIVDLSSSLEEEQNQRQEETQLLARKLAEKTKTVEQLNTSLEEENNENRVMKRRHITSIKELARELLQCRKRLDAFESHPSATGETVSLGSRASSSASLDTVASNNQNINTAALVSTPQVSPPVTFSGGKTSNPSQNLPSSVVPNEVYRQMLIERIVRLQKTLARKNDKIEFLEDHIGQLVKEMKKKSKIIQSYIVREETGALVPNSSDQNKMELTKRGGIMASVYSSHLSDSNMTLELSLEINHKLQAVLEDTLLKNITLKENINTLGEEIARLTSEQRELSRQLTRNKSIK